MVRPLLRVERLSQVIASCPLIDIQLSLKRALDEAAVPDDNRRRAWIMRHAIDAIVDVRLDARPLYQLPLSPAVNDRELRPPLDAHWAPCPAALEKTVAQHLSPTVSQSWPTVSKPGAATRVQQLAYAPGSGSLLVMLCDDQSLRAVDTSPERGIAKCRRYVLPPEVRTQEVAALALACTEAKGAKEADVSVAFVYGPEAKSLGVLDLTNPNSRSPGKLSIERALEHPVRCVAFSPNKGLVAFGGESGEVNVLEVRTKELCRGEKTTERREVLS